MDLRKMKLQHLKKQCKRAKRGYVTLWKTFGILFLVLTLLCAPLCLVVKAADNAIAAEFGGTFWKLKNRDESAIYYQTDDLDAQELSYQVMAEGAVLLKNDNKALPLSTGATVSFFGTSHLKTALETEGFLVKEDLNAVESIAIAEYDGVNTDTLQSLSDLKKAGSLKKLIVLLKNNQVSFLKDDLYNVDSVLWVGVKAAVGAKAVAELLSGKANPSGSLPETFTYEDARELCEVYAGREGIYTDYRYYETRYEDFVMGTGNAGNFVYADQVAYPFGYGLSYTSFAYSDFAVTYDENADKFEITLTVTNTGVALGKETVQVYAQSPYTDYDKQMGVEKPAVALVGFGKTGELAPGATEKVTISVDKRDLASFDAYGAKTYILDAGKYFLTAATDAHNAANNILAAKGFEVQGDAALTHSWEQPFDGKTYAVSKNGASIVSRFSNVEAQWVSRRDWEGTLSAQNTAPVTDDPQRYNPADYPTTPMPTLGAENGLKLYDMMGIPFDDAQWQTLLDQLTFGDMVRLLGDNYHLQLPVESVQAPGAISKTLADLNFPPQKVLCATFNRELSQQMGKAMGNTCLTEAVAFLWGTDLSACASDGLLAGKIYAALIAGIEEKGVVVALPLNLPNWMNEQAAREMHLRCVQYAVEENAFTGILTHHSRVGAVTHILRQEWGGSGRVTVTDWQIAEQNAADSLLAGATDFADALPLATWELSRYGNDPVIVSAMRSACHRKLYILANAAAMNGIGENTTVYTCMPSFVLVVWIATAVFFAAYIFFAVMWRRGKKKWKKCDAYLDYKTMKTTLKEEKKKS